MWLATDALTCETRKVTYDVRIDRIEAAYEAEDSY